MPTNINVCILLGTYKEQKFNKNSEVLSTTIILLAWLATEGQSSEKSMWKQKEIVVISQQSSSSSLTKYKHLRMKKTG